MNIAHIIGSHLQFDLNEMYLLINQKLKCICGFDWSNNCGEFFRRELVTVFTRVSARGAHLILSSQRGALIRGRRSFEEGAH